MKETAPLSSAFAEAVGSRLSGPDHPVTGIDAFPCRQQNCIAFVTALPTGTPLAKVTARCTVFAPAALVDGLLAAGYSVIESAAPKFDLARAWAQLFPPLPGQRIHPTAIVGPDVELGDNIEIGPFTVLDGKIRVGDGSRIGARCSLVNDVTLGRNAHLRNGNVLGEDAFSFGFGGRGRQDGGMARFPSSGGIRMGDNIEIGNNCVISRGLVDDSVYEDGVRINDLVHIGNTVTVGREAMIMAQTDISARVTIGAHCWIGQSAAIRQGVTVGEGAQVGMGAVVVDDVPPGVVTMGVPARPVRDR